MKKISTGVLVVLFLAVCVFSCQTMPDYTWRAEPEIKGAVPLPANTPIYFYFGSKIAGTKRDKERYEFAKRKYVLCTIVQNGEITRSNPLNWYRKLEINACHYECLGSKSIIKKRCTPNCVLTADGLDSLIDDEYRFCMEGHCWKKIVPDKKYLWIMPEGPHGATLKPGHLFLGGGKLNWREQMFDAQPGYDYNLKKGDFHALASYALARGANVVIIEDEYNISGEWDNLFLMRFNELLSGKP